MTFEDLGLTRQFLNALEDLGFERPTPIQEQAIPIVRGGQHVIGIAQTGTGKTAAYILPILQKLKYAQEDPPRALILVPTKELVLQVVEQVQELAKYTDLRIKGIYGGVGKQRQIAELQDGLDVLVATPRRFLELYELSGLVVNRLKTLVLDEADRMLDMGFLSQIRLVLDVLPRKKQNLLFSATFSDRIEKLSGEFMDFPVRIEVAPEATPVDTVTQLLYQVPNRQSKINLLLHLLEDEEDFDRVIVFVRTRKGASAIYDQLKNKVSGKLRVIHANKGQNTRIKAFNDFKSGDIRLLITTDVMARGIDIEEVSHVVNFNVPVRPEDYVHRIGRTGRAEKEGTAITFANAAEQYHLTKIKRKIRMTIPEENIPEEVEIPETPLEERQAIAKAIDDQKRKADPNFKGAFHEKKSYKVKQRNKRGPRSFQGKGGSTYKKGGKKKNTSKRKRNKKK